jgi:hypothetical protein
MGAARVARIRGIPAGVRALQARRTSASDDYAALPETAVRDGAASIELAAQSLTTLSPSRR